MNQAASRHSHPVVEVLLVEQDADVISAISKFVSGIPECRLHTNTSLADALLTILEKPPDILLFTHGLPGRNSLEVFTSIRNKYSSIYLIVTLPTADQDLTEEYKKAGAAECISKDENYLTKVGVAIKEAVIQSLAASVSEQTPALTDEESSSDELRSMLSALQPGEEILHYRILDAIGEGGMGEVYKAQDLKLGRTVAIKALPLVISNDQQARRRFLREAQSASKLNHSGIITIHAIDELDDFQFIVMEYVEGETLRNMLERGPLPLNRLIDIGSQIASALGAAHSAGLIHRDIKPSNIMISGQDRVKILDFGLAKPVSISEISGQIKDLTKAGVVLGTVYYMSPEQSRGEILDARTDIFSLGCVLYHAATGKMPFQGKSIVAMMNEIANQEPPAPSTINPNLPRDFDSLIARALAKDKNQRFDSAEQIATALTELKQPKPATPASINGDSISHYKITETLGHGGMGVVYKAIDQKLGRTVAIKTLLPERMGDEKLKKRLMCEARAASKLNHPNICTIYEVDEVDGNLFLVMEYIQGHTLSEEMQQGPIGIEKVLEIAAEIAAGLEKAHRENIVHRDIKPSNIALTEEGRVKILDFGLARIVEKIEAEAVTKSDQNISLTDEGQIVGTIAYMSPEQLNGKQVDTRTDIFSFGILLYEMLRGQRPFHGNTFIQLAHSILNDTPEPLKTIHTNLPVDLDRIILKALAKERESRYSTMKELQNDLVKMKQQLKEPAKTTHQDSIAVLYFENLGGLAEQEYLRDGLTEDVITELSKLERLHVFPRSAVIAFRDKAVTAPDIGRQLNASHVLAGSLRKSGNRVRVTAQLIQSDSGHSVWAERYDREMHDVFDLQDEIARALATALSIKLTPVEEKAISQKVVENPEAYDLYLQGRRLFRRGTRKDMESAAEMFKRAIVLDPNLALAFAGLGHVCGRIHRYYDQNPQWMERGIEACEKAMKIEPNLPEAFSARAFLHYGHKEYEEAIRYAKMALERKRDCEGAYFALGLSLNLTDRLEEGARFVELAIEFNGDDYNTYLPYLTIFLRLGEKEKVTRLRQQLRRVLQLHLEWAPENARARMILAGSYADNIADERLALDELEKALSYSPNDASLLMNAACAYTLLGRKSEALATLKKAIENGYRHADTLARDADLASLHGDPEFEALIKSLS